MRSTRESDVGNQVLIERPQTLPGVRTSTGTPRILLADDQEEMLRTIIMVLGDEFNIIGTAKNGEDVIQLATRLSPDVVVLDICMPVLNGIKAACRLKELGSAARVIFLTVHTDSDFVEAAWSAGALGYVLKESLAADLTFAIRSVMQGNTFISRPIRQ
jgi:DNA-binding NarL/FixJ family response regulator